jgi:hypothetical protein
VAAGVSPALERTSLRVDSAWPAMRFVGMTTKRLFSVILSEVSIANEVERISDSFAQAKPVPFS